MKAMLLRGVSSFAQNPEPLAYSEVPDPQANAEELLIRVSRCGVCHTELDEIEGRTPPARFPIIPGHQVVGRIVEGPKKGQRVGVAWIASACGICNYCNSGRENLCPDFKATGRDVDGGYADLMKVRSEFAHPIPDSISDSEAAPLLCAGAIGFRSLRLSKIDNGDALGLMGFGGSNHLVLKLAKQEFPHTPVFVFSRNQKEREFALSLGATWAGAIDQVPPQALDAIIDTTPVWSPILKALSRLKAGGRLVINAIRKEEVDKRALLEMDYPSHVWMEKEIKSIANVTRADVREFLHIAASAGIKPEFEEYELQEANRALSDLKQGTIRGAKVLCIH